MRIRHEQPSDWPAIDALNRAAFGGASEVELIGRLRQDGLVIASLVAEERGEIVGHILFSWLPTQMDGRAVAAVTLGPMAVRPDRQRQGIGSRLVLEGLAAARSAGAQAVIVLGHPGFYRRFGFSSELAARLASPFSGEAFMALELAPDALAGAHGSVAYPSAFGL